MKTGPWTLVLRFRKFNWKIRFLLKKTKSLKSRSLKSLPRSWLPLSKLKRSQRLLLSLWLIPQLPNSSALTALGSSRSTAPSVGIPPKLTLVCPKTTKERCSLDKDESKKESSCNMPKTSCRRDSLTSPRVVKTTSKSSINSKDSLKMPMMPKTKNDSLEKWFDHLKKLTLNFLNKRK